MKKISLLTITALTVISMVFLASCDNPAAGKKADPLADVIKALKAINTAVMADTNPTTSVEDLETAIDTAKKETTAGSLSKGTTTKLVKDLAARIEGLEKQAAIAVAATAKIVADEKTYDKTKATALNTKVTALKNIILGKKDGEVGIEKLAEYIIKESANPAFDATDATMAKKVNSELINVEQRIGTIGSDDAIVKLATAAVKAAEATGLKK